MEKTMAAWFHMRPGFTTFRLEPEKHPQFLLGTSERAKRDYLIGEIEGACFGQDGYKAVIFGDYGRGKTHMCHNLEFEIRRREMPIMPIYIKCSAYISKEPFQSLFREMVTRHATADIKRVATAYARLVQDGKARPIGEIVQSEDIALVIDQGLTAVADAAVRNCMRWLGGEAKIPMQLISTSLKPQLSDSREFGAVMRGLAHIYATVDGRVLLYLVDEAERFENVTNVDTFAGWLAALRELTEISGVGLMFFVGAVTRNQLPTLLLSEEVMRRIGVANYVEFTNPSRDQLKAFLLELFSTFIAKGPMPEPHNEVVGDDARNAAIPEELRLIAPNAAALEAYPFEPDALDEFVEHVATGHMASKPSEVLIRLLKASQRAMRKDKHVIGRSIVNEVNSEDSDMSKIFDIEPRVPGTVRLGSRKGKSVILAGRMAEKGNTDPITFDGSDNFVVFEVGKRGSGKSYGMGSMLEAFATGEGSRIGQHTERRAIVLLDPLDIHWPAITPLRADGPEGLRRQHQVLTSWEGLEVEPINVRVFVPAGHSWDIDPDAFNEFRLPVSFLDAGDWALLIKSDLITETRGRLIDEAYRKVTELGWFWDDPSSARAAKSDYSIGDLIDCIEHDPDITNFYAAETRRSVMQPLRSMARMPLFESAAGTPLIELARPGALSILCMGRLTEDLRTVLTTVLVRKLKADRMFASQIRRRLALNSDSPQKRRELETELVRHVPRTILAVDEAQILMPARGNSTARQALDSFVLEGRNYGLSLWLATQRPKGAISEAAASQIDTFIVHRLSVADDINAVCGLLQNARPDVIRIGGRVVDLPDLIRALDVGQAIFSSATSDAPRFVVGNIRPRNVAHGGEAF